MKDKELLFEEIAGILDFWVKSGAKSLTDQNADLIWTDNPDVFGELRRKLADAGVQPEELSIVLSELLRGFMVSFLTIIDGGTKLSERMQIRLIDDDGDTCEEFHQEFVNYLGKTNRL
jgi:hypothetical protein